MAVLDTIVVSTEGAIIKLEQRSLALEKADGKGGEINPHPEGGIFLGNLQYKLRCII